MTLTSKDGPFDWVGVTIATGPSQGTFKLKVGDVEREFDAHADTPGSKLFKLSAAGEAATLHPGGGAQTVILNWSTGRNRAGIRLTQFDLLTDKAKEVQRLDTNLIANDIRSVQPDLLVFSGVDDTGDARSAVQELIAQIRASSPQADVLFLGADNSQPGSLSSCLDGITARATAITSSAQNKHAGAAFWRWAPTRADICAIEEQLQQGLVDGEAANLTPDFAARRASALVKWLASPSNPIGKVARGKLR